MSNISQKHNLTTSSIGGKLKTKKRKSTPRKKVSKKKKTLKKNKKRSKKTRGGANNSSPIVSIPNDEQHSIIVDGDESSFEEFFPDFPNITESQVQSLEDSLYSDSWASHSMNDDSGYTTFEDISFSNDNISLDELNTAFTEEGGKKKRRK
tara:strand:+ start:441 stop:893 length:453 start_codon:yes stop_codon:yes gene_type:complete